MADETTTETEPGALAPAARQPVTRTPAEAAFRVAVLLFVLAAGLGIASAAITFGLGAALLVAAVASLTACGWFLHESILHARIAVAPRSVT